MARRWSPADARRLLEAGDRSQAALLISQAEQHFADAKAIVAVDALLRGESTIYFSGHGEIDAEQQGYWIPPDGLRDDPKTWIAIG